MKVALALGAGGARGYAHICVAEQLLARGHEIVAISGASMGSLVGACIVTEHLSELREFVLGVKPAHLVRLFAPTLPKTGLATAAGAMSELRRVLGNTMIEDLPIPFTAVASDIIGQEEIWINSGDIVSAVRASVAIPLIFTPVIRDGRYLLDGGCINPLPVEPLQSIEADVLVAVSLLAPPINPPMRGESVKLGLRHAGLYALDAMMASIERSRAAINPPDVLIDIPCDLVSVLDMHRAEDVFAAALPIVVDALDAAGL